MRTRPASWGERWLAICVRHRALVLLFVLVFAGLGLRAAQELAIDAVPDVTNIQVQVLTDAPTLGPAEVERLITFPIESEMSGLPKLETIRSVSRAGLSAITLVFSEGTDLYFARQLVSERLKGLEGNLDPRSGSPKLGPLSSGLGEIYQFEVGTTRPCGVQAGTKLSPNSAPSTDNDCISTMELRSILDWKIAYQLRNLPGVVEVNSFGGELKTYEVRPQLDRLQALDLSLGDLYQALAQNNRSEGGGYLSRAGTQSLIFAEGRLQSIEDIENVVVRSDNQSPPILIRHVADVVLAPKIRHGAVTRDGRGEVVTGTVMMLVSANAREVARSVDQKLEEIRRSLPEGVTLETYYNREQLVGRTIKSALSNLIEGGVLVIVVLLLLIGDLRAGLIVASIIPLSMAGALVGMKTLGLSGNLMSLGAIDFGIIVDGAVVMVEHVLAYSLTSGARNARDRQIIRRMAQVGRPMLFSLGIIMLVYLPLLSLRDMEGKMFKPMAWTILLALFTSGVLAITLVPALSSFFLKRPAQETWLMHKIRICYEPLLQRCLHRPGILLGACALLLLFSTTSARQLGMNFLPRLDEGALALQASRLPSVSLEESLRSTTRVERLLLDAFPDEIETIVSKTGRAEIASDPMGVETSDIYLALHDQSDWKRAHSQAELQQKMDQLLQSELPGQNYSWSQPIELRTNELLSGVRADVAVSVYGQDSDELSRLSKQIANSLAGIRGAGDVQNDRRGSLSELKLKLRREAMARHGITADQVMDAIATLAGLPVGEVYEEAARYELQVRLPREARNSRSLLERLPIRNAEGRVIPLSALADWEERKSPASIEREAVARRATVGVNLSERDLASFIKEAKAAVARDVPLPAGYSLHFGGSFERLNRALAQLYPTIALALLLIFVLLYLVYGSFKPALLVYLNIPIAATGGIFALALCGLSFSLSAAVGFIALSGIAVLNGVVLLSAAEELRKSGESCVDAAAIAAKQRLRPVMMTALTDGFGFLPMALGGGAGASVQQPLAIVVIGGLCTSTLLTLFVLPAFYARLFGQELRRQPVLNQKQTALAHK